MALETVDLPRVELVRAGGPYFGQGSAKRGDHVTVDDLQAAAASFAQLRDELWPPVKLGHNDEQDATKATYGGLLASDGAPALGWLDNLRVEGRGLYADLRRVPKRVAELVKAGAYRARSIEFWRGYRDRDGNRHPMVITGLALLGAQLPAVRGLEEMVGALYADAPTPAQQDGDGERVRLQATAGARAYAVADTWLPLADADREWDEAEARARVMAWAGATEGAADGTDAAALPEAVLARLRSAYLVWADGGGETADDFAHLIADVNADGDLVAVPAAIYAAARALKDATGADAENARARLADWYRQLGATPPWGGWQAPRTVAADDDDDFYAERVDNPDREAWMDPKELRAALGLAEDASDADVTAKLAEGREAATKLADAEAKVTKLEADVEAAQAAATGDDDGARNYADLQAKIAEQDTKIATLTKLAEDGVKAQRTLYERDRDDKIAKAVAERRLAPADADAWRTKYDAAPEVVSELLTTLTPRADLQAGETGHDGKGDADAQAKADAAYEAAFGEKPRHPANKES